MAKSNIMRINRRPFEPNDLDLIDHDFRLIMMCSNVIGKIHIVDNALVTSARTGVVVSDVALSQVINGGSATPACVSPSQRTA